MSSDASPRREGTKLRNNFTYERQTSDTTRFPTSTACKMIIPVSHSTAVHRQERTQNLNLNLLNTEAYALRSDCCSGAMLLTNLIIHFITCVHLNLVICIQLYRRPTRGPRRRSQLAVCDHSGGSAQVRLPCQDRTRARPGMSTEFNGSDEL